MTKSIHFNQVPNMRGKLTMSFTDVVAENYKPRILKEIDRREMSDWGAGCYSPDDAVNDECTVSWSWCCDICAWDDYTGSSTPHRHHDD